jgi:hypothetical protein
MQISIQLDDEHAQKLAYIQQTTQEIKTKFLYR